MEGGGTYKVFQVAVGGSCDIWDSVGFRRLGAGAVDASSGENEVGVLTPWPATV